MFSVQNSDAFTLPERDGLCRFWLLSGILADTIVFFWASSMFLNPLFRQEWLMTIQGIEVAIRRKNIKSLRIVVYPPDAKVRMSVPLFVSEPAIRRVLASKLAWIRQKQQEMIEQNQSTQPAFNLGEVHYFLGKAYPLLPIEATGRAQAYLRADGYLVLETAPHSTQMQRSRLLDAWYRQELKKIIPHFIRQWEPLVGERVSEWRIKKMKTRWGTCNPAAHRIWLNLELAKVPLACIEYVIVHEMVHFLESGHNAVFKAHMDRLLPNWRLCQKQLRAATTADSR
ncbi:MAG: M48 family metallopeptidase [Legionellaceae bacterium]|nr:M48 family metallopeptidase [Legionellaceae bacterium]